MTSLLRSVLDRGEERSSGLSFDQWAQIRVSGESLYGFLAPDDAMTYERAFRVSPPVHAAVTKRQALYSEARFAMQRMRNGRPGDLFPDRSVAIINDHPDLLSIWELDVSHGGNAYAFEHQGRLVLPRPNRVEVLIMELSETPMSLPFAKEVMGYRVLDVEHGQDEALLVESDRMAHYIERPDPVKPWRGLSWISVAHRDVLGDDLMTRHKQKFFEHAATPNLVIKSPAALTDEQFDRLREMTDRRYAGVENAHKTLLLEGGADVQVVGADIANSSAFTSLQDNYEARISLVSQVPAPVLGILLGQNPTYNNYQTALRSFIDLWARPAWRRTAHALSKLVNVPGDARLWYDARDIAALQQDSSDEADIRAKDAQTARTLTDGGYDPASVVAFLASGDPTVLTHTGLLPVQVQPPGTTSDSEPSDDDAPTEGDDGGSTS